jgi:cobalt-zinc-cadmium efflux system membrane fusion protein
VALKKHLVVVLLAGAAIACGRAVPPEAPAEEREDLSVTNWTEKTELFAEYAALTVGETSRFAIHLTQLDTFKPLTEGRVEVHLRGGTAPEETFGVDGPSRPGIFGVDVKPAHAGKRDMVIVLRSKSVADDHVVAGIDVHPDMAAAKAATAPAGNDAPGISFLKEQQWTLDFGTAAVQEQPLRESIRVVARLEARPGGAADVAAPIDGRLLAVVGGAVGTRVGAGQELARLLPPPTAPGDLPQMQRALAEAQSALAQAVRDRERAERLTAAGAAPERRLEEARLAESQARLRVTAAESSLGQFNAARSGSSAQQDGLFVIRAPITGVIARREAVTGANVSAGTVLFQIVDPVNIHVVGQIPEADTGRARTVTSAEIEIAGQADRAPVGKLVSLGRVLDPASRTLPITFTFDNTRLALPVGRTVVLYLLTNATTSSPVVPSAAVVDDAGRPIVFVQREGESFERRAVTVGIRSGGLVQVTEGLKPGERVVTKGAYLVRLAALSTTVPAHGHVH